MNVIHRTHVEVGSWTKVHQGITQTLPIALVSVETEDSEVLQAILDALSNLEQDLHGRGN